MKRISMKTTTLGVCALLLFSCNNEDILENMEGGKTCDYISFDISSEGETPARSTDGKEEYTADNFVLRAADSADTLCMRATITDGIEGTQQVISRGAPVTEITGFHVVCDRSDMSDQFFMDVDATKQGDGWGTDEIYYWPGAGRDLTFYAWAPTNILSNPTKDNLKFEYTVPDEAEAQQDLLVAKTEALPGDYKQQVPLTFDHICTAVKFVVGDQMQAGTIKSITLKGVNSKGTYTIGSNWISVNTPADFTQEVNITTDGSEGGSNKPITQDAGTFMMLPQTLPTGAMVEVIFQSATTGQEKNLTAPIENTEWPIGKTVTYGIAISPEYNFDLTTPEEDRVLDAHYEIFKTVLKVEGLPDDAKWDISGPNNLEGVIDYVTIQAQSEMNNYAKQGFWTDQYLSSIGGQNRTARGNSHYEGTGSGIFPIAVFVPENLGNAARTINLNITVNGDEDNIVKTIPLTQLAPSWYGNVGCERIEGTKTPWGFYWSEDFKLIYDLRGSSDMDARESLRRYVEWTKTLKDLSENILFGWLIKLIFGDDIPDLGFIDMETHYEEGGLFGHTYADKITLNLGTLNTSGFALSETDGVANTKEMYNFEGFQLVSEIINRIQAISGFTMETEGEGAMPTPNAATVCMKLNGWDIVTQEDDGMLKLVGEDGNPSWYLPAKDEVSGIKDETYPLKGEYWSSTAENNNQNAYKYSADGTTSVQQRDATLSIRAVCKKNP